MVTLQAMRRIASPIVAALLVALPAASASAEPALPAQAQPEGASPAPLATPEVHHAPLSTAPQHEPLRLQARLEHPEVVRWLGVVYRSARGKWSSAPFQRGGDAYEAVIPSEDVEAPGLAYAIEVEQIDGKRLALFASRDAPYPVQVIEDRMDAHERALLQRLGGRRSVATATAEYVNFGTTTGKKAIPCGANQPSCKEGVMTIPTVNDQYWRVELGYTYRPLRTVAEFSLRGGVVRGTSLVPTLMVDEAKYKVGTNYGAPTVRFRLSDSWHLETEFLATITEVGFSIGLGSAVLIGDAYGSHLTVGFETIGFPPQYFGTRFFSRVDIAAADRVKVAPIIEVTDMPHADSFGVRLLGDVTVDIGAGFSLSARGGYQARRSIAGGPSVGGSLSVAF